MRKSIGYSVFFAACAFAPVLGAASTSPTAPQQGDIYSGWLKMYDLKFDDAHRTFGAWMQSHPDDALSPASNAAAYLFSELARLGALESEFFVDDSRFKSRVRLQPDQRTKALFTQELAQADRLADEALRRSAVDANALFVKSMILGLRADDAGLVEKQSLSALAYTKQARVFAERLAQVKPDAADAYFGLGVENYLLSLEAAPVRLLLRVTGSNVDHDKGLQEISQTAFHGHYLEPFAKLLLAGAALRDNHPARARQLLWELHTRFPDNELYTREIDRIDRKGR